MEIEKIVGIDNVPQLIASMLLLLIIIMIVLDGTIRHYREKKKRELEEKRNSDECFFCGNKFDNNDMSHFSMKDIVRACQKPDCQKFKKTYESKDK